MEPATSHRTRSAALIAGTLLLAGCAASPPTTPFAQVTDPADRALLDAVASSLSPTGVARRERAPVQPVAPVYRLTEAP